MSSSMAGVEDPPDPAPAWQGLRGRAAELAARAEARTDLARRLEANLEVRRASLRQGAALDGMRRRVELLQGRLEDAVVGKRRALEGVERRRDQLQARIEHLLPLSRALAAAHGQLQEAKEELSGDRKRLGDLRKLLRMRQQRMIGQVAALYPVRVFHDLPHSENRRDDANGENGTLSRENGNGTGMHLTSVIKSPQVRHLTFLGWQFGHKTKQKSYSEKELQRSASVLGYAAHAVLLIASYLHVPLRYPLRFGGSRSYVNDCLPSAETASVASGEHPRVNNMNSKLTEYRLFLECQDESTRASYAIYLLQKDTEQLLNYIGAESSGRNAFGNLRELIRIIKSDEYVYI